ncbi:MAG: hypothetical protein ABSH38_04970 [Verrucomicrobiota bacterium]
MKDGLASKCVLERNPGFFQVPVKPLNPGNPLENKVIAICPVGFKFSQCCHQFRKQSHIRSLAVLSCRCPDVDKRCHRIQMQVSPLERRQFPSPQARMDRHQVNRLALASNSQQTHHFVITKRPAPLCFAAFRFCLFHRQQRIRPRPTEFHQPVKKTPRSF